MAIPQGNSLQEWAWCCELLSDDMPGVWYLGIPRNFREVLGHSRKIAIDIALALNPQRRIHLFGFSNDLVDDLISAHYGPHITGIDSTTPIRMGSLGYNFSLNCKPPPRGDWWETAEWNDAIVSNLILARRYWR